MNQAAHDPVPVQSQPSNYIGQQKPKQLPAYAKVITPRIPNAYDKTALRLEVRAFLYVCQPLWRCLLGCGWVHDSEL